MSFNDGWGFADEIKALVPTCARITYKADGHFRSGRARYLASLLRVDGSVIETRQAMEMLSKKTNIPYYVVRRALRVPAQAALTLDDLYSQ